jgi:hypothetical protein
VLILSSIFSFAWLNHSKTAHKSRKKRENTQIVVQSFLEMNSLNTQNEVNLIVNINKKHTKDLVEKRILILLAFLTCFVNYGFLPGLFSYSTLPYGNHFFKLSINLVSITMPISVLLSIWSYNVSTGRIIVETLIPLVLSMYILAISILSPCPPFVKSQFGGYIIVACWILTSSFCMRVRCLIATKLEKFGEKVIFAYACATILGQFFGGIIIFVLVEVYRLFSEIDKCDIGHVCS